MYGGFIDGQAISRSGKDMYVSRRTCPLILPAGLLEAPQSRSPSSGDAAATGTKVAFAGQAAEVVGNGVVHVA